MNSAGTPGIFDINCITIAPPTTPDVINTFTSVLRSSHTMTNNSGICHILYNWCIEIHKSFWLFARIKVVCIFVFSSRFLVNGRQDNLCRSRSKSVIDITGKIKSPLSDSYIVIVLWNTGTRLTFSCHYMLFPLYLIIKSDPPK